ncbi:hypothetical protein [Mesobacillus zeae]|uniref:Uncharacterized protein n=1 Tax=Mesobacillus zeae TaxID=1917180 RepID=A0A398B2M4_9BACI|nr:hypothetical protein [Mesobacillus zeae]RID83594.1 hypothetical protein D1970_15595 [Mesobacillus zeae]
MILVCSKHVKNGLKMIDLPHVHSITEQSSPGCGQQCEVCRQKPDYKLFNHSVQRKKTKENVMIGG